MFCLSCGKKIVESSKFCRYCGEKIDDNPNKEVVKNNKRFYLTSFRNFWAILWVITMLVFVLTLVIFAKFDESNINLFNNILLLKFFLFNICLGIISFIFIFFTKIVPKKPLPKFIKYGFIFLFSYLIINPAIFAIEGYKAKTNEEYKNKYYKSNIPTPIPTLVPIITLTPTPKTNVKTKTINPQPTTVNQGGQIDCIGPDGKTFKTTDAECKKFNNSWGKPVVTPTLSPKEIIKCKISVNCGGGYREMPREDCQNLTCCEVENGWVSTSKGECDKQQKALDDKDWIEFCKSLYWDYNLNLCGSQCLQCISDHT